jgi:hypothetical protein
MNFVADGLYSNAEILNFIKYKHSNLEMSQHVKVELGMGLYEGEMERKEAGALLK